MTKRAVFQHKLFTGFDNEQSGKHFDLLKDLIGPYNDTWYECVYYGSFNQRTHIVFYFDTEEHALLAKLILPGNYEYHYGAMSEI